MIDKLQLDYNLSSRESQCLGLWSKGFSMRKIGCTLDISPRTVEMHLGRVKKKMNAKRKEDVLELVHQGE